MDLGGTEHGVPGRYIVSPASCASTFDTRLLFGAVMLLCNLMIRQLDDSVLVTEVS